MQSARLDYLFLRYYEKNITEEERQEFMALLPLEENREQVNGLIDQVMCREDPVEHRLSGQIADDILSVIFTATAASEDDSMADILPHPSHARRPLWIRTLVAASISLVLIYGGYRWQRGTQLKQKQPISLKSTYGEDVVPGGNKASLTLADGQTLDLTLVTNGYLTGQPGIQVNKAKGEIAYNPSPVNSYTTATSYNTLRTPLGGQYKIILPDGSVAWLNAGSSLKYPTLFSGTKREVEMSGEIYFEIEPNKQMPFTVRVNHKHVNGKDAEITVLGTHFNISSYGDEPVMQTTLLEGSVKVEKGNKTRILTPGQQAQIATGTSDQCIAVKSVDTETVVAWKEGRFEFNGSIKDIMRQISRWYDLEVSYEGNVGSKSFVGAVSRKTNVSEVLKMLELTGGIQFHIEDRKITVKNAD